MLKELILKILATFTFVSFVLLFNNCSNSSGPSAASEIVPGNLSFNTTQPGLTDDIYLSTSSHIYRVSTSGKIDVIVAATDFSPSAKILPDPWRSPVSGEIFVYLYEDSSGSNECKVVAVDPEDARNISKQTVKVVIPDCSSYLPRFVTGMGYDKYFMAYVGTGLFTGYTVWDLEKGIRIDGGATSSYMPSYAMRGNPNKSYQSQWGVSSSGLYISGYQNKGVKFADSAFGTQTKTLVRETLEHTLQAFYPVTSDSMQYNLVSVIEYPHSVITNSVVDTFDLQPYRLFSDTGHYDYNKDIFYVLAIPRNNGVFNYDLFGILEINMKTKEKKHFPFPKELAHLVHIID